ncbi:MAG: hypothetical protein KF699_04530 [Phycisphaeraceae bacterium]|nr:hypothetical protein [Phycisphaeraceae bacterium]
MRQTLGDNYDRRERPERERAERATPAGAGSGRRVLRRAWRIAGTWPFTVAAIVLLWANARYLSVDASGNWPALAPRGNIGQPDVPAAVAVLREGRVVCVDLDSERDTDRVLTTVYYAYRARSATSGVVNFEMEDVLGTTVGGPAYDPAEVRAAYIAWLGAHKDAFWRRTASRMSGTTAAATGYSLRLFQMCRMIGVVLLIALLVRSLAWTIPILDAAGRALSGATLTPAERAAIKRRKAMQRGQCPACGYDIRRLPARVCPECAHRWNENEADLLPP